jgi:hypothetical protein
VRRKTRKRKLARLKTKLGLPDLEQAKAAVLASLRSRESQCTVNVRLAAVRRLAYEAADTGLLSPDLAAGVRRVKSSKKLGMRLGNWLTAVEARTLWRLPGLDSN